MAKKGGNVKLKRIAVPAVLPVRSKKNIEWLSSPLPGRHPKSEAISMVVLLRDVIGIAKNSGEVKNILRNGHVKVDGSVVSEQRFAVGIMDVIEVNDGTESKFYQMFILHQGLRAVEIDSSSASHKIRKITGKSILQGGKVQVSFHDGTTMVGDSKFKVNDSAVIGIGDSKVVKLIAFKKGARVYVTKGKHKGKVMTLEQVISRPGSKEDEAQVVDSSGATITTTRSYLFPVEDEYVKALIG